MKSHAANLLTLSRLVLIFPLVFLIPYSTAAGCWVALGGYLFLVLTDALDGFVARRWEQESDFGKICDPFADRLMLLIFLPLLQSGYISYHLFGLILGRDLLVLLLRALAGPTGLIIPARPSGQYRTALVYSLAATLLLGAALHMNPAPSWFSLSPAAHAAGLLGYAYDQLVVTLAWAMVAITIVSLADYLHAHRGLILRIARNPRAPLSALSPATQG